MFRKGLQVAIVLVTLGTLVGTVGAAPPDPAAFEMFQAFGITATPCPTADPYEDDGGADRDDSFATASTLTTAGQPGHSFDLYADKDWAEFEAQAGYVYVIATENLQPVYGPSVEFYADTVLELYGPDGVTLLDENDDYGGTHASRIEWLATQSGTYYVKVYNYSPAVYGCDVGYDLTLAEEGSLQIAKSAEDLNGAPLFEGDVIRYTVTVTNGSTTIPHTNVVITDPIPAGTTFVDSSDSTTKGTIVKTTPTLEVRISELAPGEVVAVVFDVRVDPSTQDEDVVNQAYVRSDQLSPAIGTPPATPSGGGQVAPGLTIVKTALDMDGGVLSVGDVVSYTIVVTNSSTVVHTNVIVTDYIPDGTTYITGSASIDPGTLELPVLMFDVGTLAPGGAVRIQLAVRVNDGVTQIGGNVAGVESDQQGSVATDPVYPPPGTGEVGTALGLYKAAKDLNGGPLYAGDEILYTIAVVNLLGEPQTNVTITDAVPEHTTFVPGSASLSLGSVAGPDPLVASVGTLQPGQRAILSFRVTVDEGAAGKAVGNSAQASSDQQDPPVGVGPVEPEPSGGTVLDGQQALAIFKAAEDLNGGPLYAGDEILYTISVINLLTTTQQNVTISDAIPDYTTLVPGSDAVTRGSVVSLSPVIADVGVLQPGEEAVLTFRVTVDGGAAGQAVENTAQASSNLQSPPVVTPPVQPYPDPIPGDPDSGGGWVLEGDQQIGINKSARDVDGTPLNPSDTIEYTVVIWNEVSVTQTNVVVTDYIPDYTTYVDGSAAATKGTPSGPDPLLVDVGTLDVGERVTVTFQVTVNAGAIGQTITNQAWVSSDLQVPSAYTPPVTTPDGGAVVAELWNYWLYIPRAMRNY